MTRAVSLELTEYCEYMTRAVSLELTEYCEYITRAVSLELTESEDRYSTASMAAVPAVYAVYNPNAIYIYINKK
jgi:hypothetical protein